MSYITYSTNSQRLLVAGFLTTVAVCGIICKRNALLQYFEPQHREKKSMPVKADSSGEDKETIREVENSLMQRSKEFHIRKRLRHEPPEFDYTTWEVTDKVQKTFKESGGCDMAWKTQTLDALIDMELICDYEVWAQKEQKAAVTEDEKLFYEGLVNSLGEDVYDVFSEWGLDVNERHGKTTDEGFEVNEFIKSIRLVDWKRRGIETDRKYGLSVAYVEIGTDI